MKTSVFTPRRFLLVCMMFFFVNATFADGKYHYYHKGEKIDLTLNKKIYNITVFKDFQKTQLSNYDLRPFELGIDIYDGKETGYKYAKLELSKESASEEQYWRTLKQIKNEANIRTINPCFVGEDGSEVLLSDYIYVRLNKASDATLLQEQAKKHNVVVLGQDKYMPLWYAVRCTEKTAENTLDVANALHHTGLFSEVNPELLDMKLNCTNDPLFSQMWGLLNSSNGAYDINACQAWNISKGNNIKVAVVDNGVQLNHTDLAANISSLSFNTETGAPPSQLYGSHGTHTAGTIGAVGGNSKQVIGVAPKCELMSVSFAFNGSPNGSQKLASGIMWAKNNGADVISNSWGGGLPTTIMEDAIDKAITQGRNGKGCIVVFSSGNGSSSTVGYPARYRPEILAVGNMRNTGLRNSSSNYGAKLDLVAPGTSILSTVPTNGTGLKTGTSMSCPHVSGVAALLLSIKPCLTVNQVNDIIESTAQKARTSTYTYTNTAGRPNGTWNIEMGYGLLDAYAAVKKAQSMSCSASTCNTTITTFPYANSFEKGTVDWQNVTGDNFDWTLRSGSTPSGGTGPSSAAHGSYYYYTEASGSNSPNKVAILEGPCFDLTGKTNMRLTFNYHMYGTGMGNLRVQVSTNGGASWSTISSITGNKGNSWKSTTVSLSAYANKTIKIRFRGQTGANYRSDMAIDNIHISKNVLACTSTIVNFPYIASFESNYGGWSNTSADDFNWTRRSGATPSGGTGPSSAQHGKYYIYTEASGNNSPNKKAIIYTPCFDLSSQNTARVAFYYHMYGSGMGNLKLQMTTNNGQSWTTIWTKSSNQGNAWKYASVNLKSYVGQTVRFRFIGTTGSNYKSDMAIDNFKILTSSTAFCTSTVSKYPYTQRFEKGIGPWQQETNDNLNWSRRSGGTPSSYTGPPSAYEGSYYAYIEASSPNYPNKTGILNSPCFKLRHLSDQNFTFNYHMYGAHMGLLQLQITSDNGQTWSTIWSKSGNQGYVWKGASVNVGAYKGKTVKFRFVGTTANGYKGDMAIDNIRIGSSINYCYVNINNFPYNFGFDGGIHPFRHDATDDFNWARRSGGTPSSYTGPPSAYSGCCYVYLEASHPNNPNKVSRLLTPCIDLTSVTSPRVKFKYHMYGADMGRLRLQVSTDNGVNWTTVWAKYGNQGYAWKSANVNMNNYAGGKIIMRFEGKTANGFRGDMAIDAFQVTGSGSGQSTTADGSSTENNSENIIMELDEDILSVYPNPARTYAIVNYQASTNDKVSIALFDILGKKVYSTEKSAVEGTNEFRLPLENVIPGNYMIMLKSSDGEVFTDKVTVEK